MMILILIAALIAASFLPRNGMKTETVFNFSIPKVPFNVFDNLKQSRVSCKTTKVKTNGLRALHNPPLKNAQIFDHSLFGNTPLIQLSHEFPRLTIVYLPQHNGKVPELRKIMLAPKRTEGQNEKAKNATIERATTSHNNDFRWKAALESAEHGVWEVNLTSNAQFHSDDWFKIRGFDPRDREICNGDAWLARIHPDDLQRVRSEIAVEHKTGSSVVWREYREKNARGEYQWILSRGRVYFDPVSGDKLAIGTDSIITETKQAQARLQALADTEQRWRVAVESAKQGLWDINHETGENYFSDDWRLMRGIQPNEPEPPTSNDWFDTIHPSDRERLTQEFAARDQSNRDDVRHEYRQRRQDGSWAWIMSCGKVVSRDSHGNIKRMIGTDTDISAIKDAEAKSHLLADRFDFAMSTSQVCVWELDLTHKVYLWNADMRALFGVGGENSRVSFETWASRIHKDDRQRVLRASNEASTAKSRYDIDYRISLPSGELRHIRCRAAYRWDEVNGCKLIGASWDVSADYALAEELTLAKVLAEERANELEKTRAKLEYSANFDALTGLCNRRQLDQRLKQIDEDKIRNGQIALLHIDLDRFKAINDTLGHRAGDQVLIEVAKILMKNASQNALVARSGGDEFVILIENAGGDKELCDIATNLVQSMKQPIQVEGHECFYGASIGIATSDGFDTTAQQLLINADIALYGAKNAGRNQFSFFSQSTQARVVDHKKTADAILRGLDRDEFYPVYQLQFDAKTLEVSGVEALARWNHPEHGNLAPDRFVSVAEDINAISKIDDIILRKSLQDLARWDKLGIDIPHLSVNVSSRRLSDENLMHRLRDLEFEVGRLSFELLESIFLDRQSGSISTNLTKLRERGIGIEIDDFGTGHASIACLLDLRPNKFKIDRSLVQPLLVSVEQRRLVSSILDIGKALGIEVVAEGVETLDHAKALDNMDCNYLQGYGLARPMKAAQLEIFVSKKSWMKAA